MNKRVIKYRAYKALIESDLSSEQKTFLVEAGFLEKVARFFGLLPDKDSMPQDLQTIFSNEDYGKQIALSKRNIDREIENIKKVVKSAGGSEQSVYDILNLTLKDSEIPPKEVSNPPDPKRPPEIKAKKKEEVPESTSLDKLKRKDPKALTNILVTAVAKLAGQDVEKARTEADEKNVDVVKALKAFAQQISNKVGVPADKCKKIIDRLINNDFLISGKLEESRIFSGKDAQFLIERWSKLAKLSVLTEAPGDEDKKDDPKVEGDPALRKKYEKVLADYDRYDILYDDKEEINAAQILDILKTIDETGVIQVDK